MHSVPLRWGINCCNSTCGSLKGDERNCGACWWVWTICCATFAPWVRETFQAKLWYVENSCKTTPKYTTPSLGSQWFLRPFVLKAAPVITVCSWWETESGKIGCDWGFCSWEGFSAVDKNHWWRHYPALHIWLAWYAGISWVNSFSFLCTRRRIFLFFSLNIEAGCDTPAQCLVTKKTQRASRFQPLPSIRTASHINTEPLQRSRGAENEQPPASQRPPNM